MAPSRSIRKHPTEAPTADQVQVDTINFLATVEPAVQNQSVSLRIDFLFFGQACRRGHRTF